ncbi:MAG: hypothetical protein Q7S02_03140 [bacterium]|nr:hypothetical protein [bacterium]
MTATTKKKLHPLTTLKIDWFEVLVSLVDLFACGGVEGEFEVRATVSSRGLTPEGFVIEVRDLMDQIIKAYSPTDGCDVRTLQASCEQLCGGVVHVVSDALGDRLEEMTVEVRNLTGSVELTWRKGEVVPAFPRVATDEEMRRTEDARRQPEYERAEAPQRC